MESRGVRKSLELSPKLLRQLQSIAGQTDLTLDNLVNLAVYELVVRLGHMAPPSTKMAPPPGTNLLDRVEPEPPPVRKVAPNRAKAKAPAPSKQRATLYLQLDKGEFEPVRKNVFLIGRGSKCDYTLKHRGVSREHAVITRERSGWFVEDLNSANGVWLNGEQIGKHKVSEGDAIHISSHVLCFAIRNA